KAFAKDVFVNQERKLGARRRLDTVLVSTKTMPTRDRWMLHPRRHRTLREIKVSGFRGEYGRKAET
ncbi:hypothetical protein CLOM_g17389, partial [Closterium sp. NIES-68]